MHIILHMYLIISALFRFSLNHTEIIRYVCKIIIFFLYIILHIKINSIWTIDLNVTETIQLLEKNRTKIL